MKLGTATTDRFFYCPNLEPSAEFFAVRRILVKKPGEKENILRGRKPFNLACSFYTEKNGGSQIKNYGWEAHKPFIPKSNVNVCKQIVNILLSFYDMRSLWKIKFLSA